MRRALIVLWLVAAASPAAAQLKGIEVSAGEAITIAKRNAAFDSTLGTATGTMSGFDMAFRAKWFGAEARLFGGKFAGDSGSTAGGKIANGDINLYGGPSTIALLVGYGRRGFTGAFGSTSWSFIRVGVRSDLPLGGSGLHAGVAIAIYTGVSSLGGTGKGTGKEAVTSLTYTPERIPIYVMLGYRREQFTATSGSNDRPEELSGIVFGGGVRLKP
jgi:hypothetical protein